MLIMRRPPDGRLLRRRVAWEVRNMVAREIPSRIKKGFKSYEEKVLSLGASEAHPGWQKQDPGTVLIAGALVFRKVSEFYVL